MGNAGMATSLLATDIDGRYCEVAGEPYDEKESAVPRGEQDLTAQQEAGPDGDQAQDAAEGRPEELRLLEALLFAASEPLDEKTLGKHLPPGIQVRAALEGNDLEGPVRPLVGRLAAALGISALELTHIETVLRIQRSGGFRGARAAGAAAAQDRELEEAYRVLETPATASDEQVAKAYRRQLQRHHPDKLKAHGLPESMLAHAKQRTQQIIEAWEIVRERRGMR